MAEDNGNFRLIFLLKKKTMGINGENATYFKDE